ncbi:MAG: chemotaxis-specific protein-glutamate methyltransferase CheB [Candidatus Krumholzibacteria bacterium]|nr:chemotaxis-specific protein-glutamate methyltransferase CheB [Candidatus Krumholzibacteria bacterium]
MASSRIKEKMDKIRVVVGEDSPFMRRMIEDSLNSDPMIEVVAIAANGREVLKKLVEVEPDVITLDLEMPRMDGLETLRYIMSEWPTPVVILSGHSAEGARMVMTCLEYGAVDFVAKSPNGSRFPVEELISKVKLAAGVEADKVRFAPTKYDLKTKIPSKSMTGTGSADSIVLIGASTGGPQVVMDVIPRLPADLDAGVLLLQHMPPNFTRYLAERLDTRSPMSVREAEEGDELIPGRVLVAPGGMHLFLDEGRGRQKIMLLPRNRLRRSACPSIDFAMTSFAPVFERNLLAVILTGMGRDGAAGSVAVRKYGGRVICQDRETSMIFGMPGAVVDEGMAEQTLPVGEIAECIESIVSDFSKHRQGERT